MERKESGRCVIPAPKKHDPYYDRMIDLQKAKIATITAELAAAKEENADLKAKISNGDKP
jgi:hypothetical protein